MADKTKIEWTDATWNVINGCTVVSPGCANCYAMRLAATRHRNHPARKGLARMHNGHPQWTGEVSLNRKVALDPIKWSAPRMIFVCAHGDLFHESVPDGWIDFVFWVASRCPQHTFQVLTKRPERMREYMQMVLDEPAEQMAYRFGVAAIHAGLENQPTVEMHWPPKNVWLGTSVEDQQRANERIPALLATPAEKRWLSMEPLLGPVNIAGVSSFRFRGAECLNALTGTLSGMFGDYCSTRLPPIDWVVAGGESGPGSRPMHPDWARKVRDDCAAAGVPFLFKQWGDWHPFDSVNVEELANLRPIEKRLQIVEYEDRKGIRQQVHMSRVGKRNAGRKLDGVLHDGFPA